MPVVNAYCTVADVRTELGDDTGKLDAGLVEKAVNAASRAVDRYCGRRFWRDAAPVARLYRPYDPRVAYVDDLASTDGLLVETAAVDGSGPQTWITWAGSDFQLEPLNADAAAAGDTAVPFAWWQITATGPRAFPCRSSGRSGGRFGWRPVPALRVTARYGWSAIPEEVREATILRAVALFKRKEAPYGIAQFGEFGPVRISRSDPDVAALLAPYVLDAVA